MMSESLLSSFSRCLRQLDSERITERKKQVEHLENLLRKPEIVKLLDRNTDRKKRGESHSGQLISQLTWGTVFKAVQNYIAIEIDRLRKRGDTVETLSATSLSNWNKDKQACSTLFKTVVKAANQRKPRLNVARLLNQIVIVLEDDFMCSVLGLDCTNILLKDVLTISQLYGEISLPTFQSLIQRYMILVNSPPIGWDRCLLTQAICHLTDKALSLYDLKPQLFFKFILSSVKVIRSEKGSSYHEGLLCALNTVCRTAGLDCRQQMCHLGEEIIVQLTYLWNNKASELMKEYLLEFFRLQIAIHHPCDRRTPEDGASASNWEAWVDCLKKLYSLIYNELKTFSAKTKYSLSKDFNYKPKFIALTVEVCHHAFSLSEPHMVVTQYYPSTDVGSSSKRQRIEIGIQSIISSIQDVSSTEGVIPFFQLLYGLLSKYPESMNAEDLTNLLELLFQIHLSCKQLEIKSWLIKCCHSVVMACCYWKEKDMIGCKIQMENFPYICHQHWERVIKTVAINHCHEESHQLLQLMLIKKLVIPRNEFYRLYAPGSGNIPSKESISTLLLFLQNYAIPCHQPSFCKTANINEVQNYWFQHQVLDWLFPTNDDLITNINSSIPSCIKSQELTIIPLLANLIIGISVQNSRILKNLSQEWQIVRLDIPDWKWIEELENDYLKISFDKFAFDHWHNEEVVTIERQSESGKISGKVNVTIWKSVQERITKMPGETLELVAQLQPIENNILLVEAYLIIKILQGMFKYNILTAEKIRKSGLSKLAKDLIETASNKILSRFEETKILDESLGPLHTLESILSGELYKDIDKQHRKDLAVWTISLFPINLPAFCLEVVNNKDSYSIATAQNKSFRQSDINLDSDSDMDLPFENEEKMPDRDDLMKTEQSNEYQGIATEQNLINNHIQLCCTLLCQWYQHAILANNEVDYIPSSQDILKKLLAAFHCNSSKTTDYCTVQMAFKTFKFLLEGNYSLEVTELSTITDMLRCILNKHHKEQEISICCLDILTLLIPYISQENCTDEIRKIRKHAVHLVQVFWKRQSDNKYNSNMSLALARIMFRILEQDPHEKWMLWSGNSSDQNNQLLLTDFLNFLKNKHYKVRVFVAINTKCFFKKNHLYFSSQCQSAAFDKIYVAAISSLQSQENLKPLAQIDEKNNRTATLLLSLSYIILFSPYCEKLAVFALCQSIKEKNIPVNVAIKALTQVSELLKYTIITDFIHSHLPFLINEWLKQKYILEDFPFQLLHCETLEDFYKEYYVIIVPLLFHHHDLTTIQNLCKIIKCDWLKILKECLPQLLGQILPWFASSTSNNSSKISEQQQAVKSHGLLEDILSKNVVENALEEKLEEVIMCLLNSIKNTPELESNDNGNSACIQADNPPSFSIEMIQMTICYLMQSCCTDKKKSLARLLSRKQDGIQKLLLFLRMNLARAHRQQEKRRGLLIYNLFVELLLPELPSGLDGNSPFLIRDIITMMIHCLDEKSLEIDTEEKSKILCIEIIHKICQKSFPLHAKIIQHHLPKLVSILVAYVDQTTSVGRKALSLLNYLLVDNTAYLEDVIAHLIPLPEKPAYKKIHDIHKNLTYTVQFSLEEEMSRFMYSYGNGQAYYKLEALQHFHLQLQQRKSELKMMIHNLQERTLFSEDINLSIIHKVVCALIHISTYSDPEIREVATKCLGEIGPIDFSTIVLQPSEYFQQEAEMTSNFSGVNPQYKCYYIVLNLLNDFLQDKRIDVVCTTAKVLKNIFATKTGRDFMNFYEKQKLGNLHLYLQPFYSDKKIISQTEASNGKSGITVDSASLWCPDNSSHEEWIINLVSNLIKDNISKDKFLQQLEPICRIEVNFSEKVLPYLIYTILLQGDVIIRDEISHQITAFFSNHCSESQNCTNWQLSTNASVRTMLSVIHHLRCNQRYGNPKATSWDNQFWLDINYLHVAQAAQFCSAPFTSLLYTEIWCDAEMRKRNARQRFCSESEESSSSQESSLLVAATHSEPTSSVLFHKLLNEAYSSIGVMDGEYVCQNIDINSKSNQINYYIREKQWNNLLSFQDLCLSSSSERLSIDVLKTMQKCGLYNVLQDYVNNVISKVTEPPPQLLECQHECAWRMSQWNLPNIDSLEVGLQQAVYRSLSCLNTKDQDGFKENLNVGWSNIVQKFCHLSLESVQSVYTALGNLQMLCSIQNYSQSIWGETALSSVIQQWKNQHILPFSNFEFVEPVLWMQCVLLKQHDDSVRQGHSSDNLIEFLQNYAEKAIEELEIEVAQKAIYLLGMLKNECNKSFQCKILDAKLHWIRGEHLIANQKLKYVLKLLGKCTGSEMAQLHAKALILNGEWLSEICSASSSMIMRDYFERAVEILKPDPLSEKETTMSAVMWDACLSVARYADAEYQRIINYINSPNYQSKLEIAKHSYQEYLKMNKKSRNLDEDDRRIIKLTERQVRNDSEEAATIEREKFQFLQKAIENYLRCLLGTNKHNLRVFRLIALWFQNHKSENINQLIKNGILQIQTYKFLPLMYQLAARMTIPQPNESEFYSILLQLIKKITLDHPYHTLPIILALKNAEADLEHNPASSSSPTRKEERVEAAKLIISELKKSRLQELVTEMEVVCSAYIQLANQSLNEKKVGDFRMSPRHAILKIKEFDSVPVLTSKIKISPNCNYENIEGIKSFLPEYEIIGGMNVPKIITCMSSNGKKYKQLVKGKDDLRQDAVMQQVFNLVNSLLENNKETKKRKLNLRTYKVIPLSRRSGVLEWCERTQTLSEYLNPPRKNAKNAICGAHERYFPYDWSTAKCCEAMKDVASKSFDEKKKVYKTVCQNLHPVFRYFFLEHFPEPSSWFERRLAYTQSVATSSIVGYIVGLGDRHVKNILIDLYTAEIVHIDFGIAFEKGKVLPTPETVPFRLTRDVVDGMGICGTEGIFKRCAEKTMEVMRDSKEILLTILEVFLYDPLYDWTLSPKLAAAHQQCENGDESYSNESTPVASYNSEGSDYQKCQGEVNKEAERALIRLEQKLQGIENGVTMNVGAQVNLLMQQARDPDNLCRIYRGWQPYL